MSDAGAPVLLEIVLIAEDFSFGGRDEIEDPLEEDLANAELGEVTGGGTGGGVAIIDVEVVDLERGLKLVKATLERLGCAPSTVINTYGPVRARHRLYGQPDEITPTKE